MRIGHGWDLHRLEEGRPLILGGVLVPSPRGAVGHSDADVVLHALMDALLGASALGEIGGFFPDTDPKWRGADSSLLCGEVVARVAAAGFRIVNVDLTLILETPRMVPHRESIRLKVASLLGLEKNYVGLKTKSSEGLGEIGKGLAVACHAVVLLDSR